MSFGKAEIVSEIEKIKLESTNYLIMLNVCGVIDQNAYNYVFNFYEDFLMKAYEQGRKDAQQETCEDAVSRKKVIDAVVTESQIDGAYGYMDTKSIVDLLNGLPPVTPKRKKGKWISLDDCRGKYNENGYKCSECGEYSGYGEENFCPNCGADMREGDQDDSV